MSYEREFAVEAEVSQAGTRFFRITTGDTTFRLAASNATPRGGGLDEAFGRAGIVLTPKERTVVVEKLSKAVKYQLAVIAEKGGWVNGETYVDRGGRCWSGNAGVLNGSIAFQAETRGLTSSGTSRQWKAGPARSVIGQTLWQFILMVGIAGPLLCLVDRSVNLIFEIYGLGGEGKSSLVQFVASLYGASVDRGQGTYWFNPSGTTNWLEQRLLAHADATCFVNEFEVFAAGETEATRAKSVYDLIFRFAEGQSRGRLSGDQSVSYNGILVTTGNTRVREMMGRRYTNIINPTTSRVITLDGDAGHGYGTLDFVPNEFQDARSFVSHLLEQTVRLHGTTMPDFVRQLAAKRAKDEARLRRRIAHHMGLFIRAAEGEVGGMDARIIEGFAIPYVAGRLAQHFRLLPRRWDSWAIAMESYRRYKASVQASEARPAVELIREYAARRDIIDLDLALPDLTDEELKSTTGFRRVVSGQPELSVPPESIARLFADWERRKGSLEIGQYLRRDGEHLTRKRVVRQPRGDKTKDRMHVFQGF